MRRKIINQSNPDIAIEINKQKHHLEIVIDKIVIQKNHLISYCGRAADERQRKRKRLKNVSETENLQ